MKLTRARATAARRVSADSGRPVTAKTGHPPTSKTDPKPSQVIRWAETNALRFRYDDSEADVSQRILSSRKDRGIPGPVTLQASTVTRNGFIAPSLHEQVENLAFVVNRAPKPELPASNRHGHLIEMPTRCWPLASTAKFSGEQRPKLQNPSPHRFVGHIEPTLSEQISTSR
jgi:hypothetical protein